MTFSDSDASRIIAALDARAERKFEDGAQISSTRATVSAVDAYQKVAAALLYGETDSAYQSEGFRIPEEMYLTVGDKVKVAINYATGERWIEEVNAPATTYKKFAVDLDGVLYFGTGTTAPDTTLSHPYAAGMRLTGSVLELFRGTTGWAVVVNDGTNNNFVLDTAGSLSWAAGGGSWDTILYRSAAGILKTDGTFVAAIGKFGGTTGDAVFIGNDAKLVDVDIADSIGVQGQSNAYNGGFTFGSAKDTNLYRSAANQLKTDDALYVAANTYSGNGTYLSNYGYAFLTEAGAAQTISAKGIRVSTSYSDPSPYDAGIQFGADVNLYRSAANALRTEDSFMAASITTGDGSTSYQTYMGNGNLEITHAADPFIDFKLDTSIDYNWRMIYNLSSNGRMQFIGDTQFVGQPWGTTGVLPYAMQQGTASVTLSAQAANSTAVTFSPSGKFGVAPMVFCAVTFTGTAFNNYKAVAVGMTTSGFTCWVAYMPGTNVTATVTVNWVAIQMTSAASAG